MNTPNIKFKIPNRGIKNEIKTNEDADVVTNITSNTTIVKSPFPLKFNKISLADKDTNGNIFTRYVYSNGVAIVFYGDFLKYITVKSGLQISHLIVLKHIVQHTDYAGNYSIITQQDLAYETELSIKTVNDAINWLHHHHIIMKDNRSSYIINHNYCMKGSFSKFVEKYKELYPEDFDDED